MPSTERDLVFVGGGHTHVLAIKRFGMKPIEGVRLTLISESSLTPYSGMLPGFVAGHYSYLDTHIDLNRLCQWANVRFIQDKVTNVDSDAKQVSLDSDYRIRFDTLSIDIGSTPDLRIPGAKEFAVGVKPISHFGSVWNQLHSATSSDNSGRWGIVGAGAGGVELVLAMAHRLQEHSDLSFHLVFAGSSVLSGYPDKVVETAERALDKYKVSLHPGFRVTEVSETGLESNDGDRLSLTKSIWCTGAKAADWLKDTGLALSDSGFIAVNEYLQSQSHKDVFAVGDCADMLFDPRPKAGVYAVRQAPFLVDNLRAHCAQAEKKLRPVRLQNDFLSLLSLGDTNAVGCRNGVTMTGRWVWKLKDRIDRAFMRKLNEPGPKMPMAIQASDVMHCAGCGSKLGPELVRDSLDQLPIHQNASINAALGQAKDASTWSVTPGKLAVQSIDGFRTFTQDVRYFGRICVNHALSDLYAMGAQPVSAQVWVNLEHAHPRIQSRDYQLLMTSVAQALHEERVTLSGGHSTEGLETHLALAVNGEVSSEDVLEKDAVSVGDKLVLTKPLGTGLILAADMSAHAPAQAVDAAFASMLQSNRVAALLFNRYRPSAVTDVTGFSLIGHLLEMLGGSSYGAHLYTETIPVLDGALELSEAGHHSTLYPSLFANSRYCEIDPAVENALIDILFDPQTSGGLLIAIGEVHAKELVKQLPGAAIVGEVISEGVTGTAANGVRIQIS